MTAWPALRRHGLGEHPRRRPRNNKEDKDRHGLTPRAEPVGQASYIYLPHSMISK